MAEFVDYLRHLNDTNWGNGPYQWMFYAGIILVFIFEKKKIARIIFAWLPFLFLIAIYNPLFNKLIRGVFLNPDPYYVRMFSFIPVTYGIGVGLMQVLTRMKGYLKALCLVLIAALIATSCTDVYQALGMTPAANPEKVPAGVMEVIEAVRNVETGPVCVAVPYPLSTSIRQVDAGLITPYGRDEGFQNSLHGQLSQAIPDVQNTMLDAGNRGVDYIVVYKSDECREAFRAYGYEPWAETAGYIIYAVSNVPRVKYEYDETHHITKVTELDSEGNPIKNAKGYTAIAFKYDDWGYKTQVDYLDQNGNPVMINLGFSSVKYTYRLLSGLLSSLIYTNLEEEPALVDGRYETRYEYDSRKRLIRESYYDAKGQPMNRTDVFYASRTIEYNKGDQIVRENYYGVDGEPVICSHGYSSLTREYDDNGQLLAEIYYNDGQLIENTVEGY